MVNKYDVGAPHINFSPEETLTLMHFLSTVKKEQTSKEFVAFMLSRMGKDDLVKILKPYVSLFTGILIGFEEAADDSFNNALEEANKVAGVDIVKSLGKMISRFNASETELPKTIPVYQPSCDIDREIEAIDDFFRNNDLHFDIYASLMTLWGIAPYYPERLKDDPLLKKYILPRWVSCDSQTLLTALFLCEYLGLPYNEFHYMNSIITSYALRWSDDFLEIDTETPKKRLLPKIDIDKPLSKVERSYLAFLSDAIQYDNDASYSTWKDDNNIPQKEKKTESITMRQLFYLATSVHFPKELEIIDSQFYEYLRLGCTNNEAALLCMAETIAANSRYDASIINGYLTEEEFKKEIGSKWGKQKTQEEDDKDTEELEEEDDEEDKEESLSELRKENSTLKEQCQRLSKQLQAISHETHSKDKTQRILKEENESQRLEIAKLKETLLSLQGEDDILESSESKKTIFPYALPCNEVLFGGRDNFLANISELLPNLRLVPTTKADYAQIIHNADFIYLQTNAMSHAMFDNLTTIVKRENKSLNYLKSSSARNSAQQIVNDIENAKKKEP